MSIGLQLDLHHAESGDELPLPELRPVKQEKRFIIKRWDQEWLEAPAPPSQCSTPSSRPSEIETVYTDQPSDGNPWTQYASPHVSFMSPLRDYSEWWYRRSQYWFPDGSITIIVSHFEYKLHLSLLQFHSRYFKTLKADSVHNFGQDLEVWEWELWLSHVYPGVAVEFDESKRTIPTWYDLYKIANYLDSHDILFFARQKILDMCQNDGVRMIFAGRSLRIQEWLFEGYNIICQRSYPLMYVEAKWLLPKELWMATKLREMFLSGEIEEVTEPVYLELMEEIARASGPVTILGGDEDEEEMEEAKQSN